MAESWLVRKAQTTHIEIDLSRWPIIITTPPPRAVSDLELDDFLERLEHALRIREGRYVSVIDLRNHIGITPKQQQMLARRMNHSHDAFTQGRLSGTAMVFTSALMRSLLTGMFWLRKSKHRVAVFAQREQAIEWGEHILTEYEEDTG